MFLTVLVNGTGAPVDGAIVSAFLSGQGGEGLLLATLNFPVRLFGWEGLQATLCIDWKVILSAWHGSPPSLAVALL